MILLRSQFHMAFFAAALAIAVSVLVFTVLQRRTDRPQNKWFLFMIFIVSINSISELCTAYFESMIVENENYYIPMVCSQTSYFLFHACLCPSLFNYVSTVTGKFGRRNKIYSIILQIPFLITEALVITNPIFDFVFYYDSNFVFHRNWGEYLIYVAAVFYFIHSVFELLFSWHAITPRRSVALVYFYFLTFIGVLIQMLFIDIKSELLSEALAIMGAMLAIESEDDRLDADTLIYNRRAMLMDVNNVLVMKNHANLIFIKIVNSKVLERVTRSANYDNLAIACSDYLKTLVPRYKIYHPNNDTFVIILSKADKENVDILIKTIKQRFKNGWDIYDSVFKLDALVLKASIPEDVNAIDDIVYITDSIIPSQVGLNNVVIDWIMRRADIERAIKTGVIRNSFEVYYQPTMNIKDSTIHGAEALVRLVDASVGKISPEEFIPIAEQIGLVDQIDDYVLREVCKFIQTGIPRKAGLFCINVNLSVIQCLKPGFFEHILRIIDSYYIDHSSINFEITESVGAEDYETLSQVAHQLKAAGFHLSMDDYGTGYSNMDGIFSLDFDVVKIDKMILWSAEKEHRGKVILENSVKMIHDLGCKVLIEGVETENQIEMLKNLNADYGQGFYFSKPLTQADFIEYLEV